MMDFQIILELSLDRDVSSCPKPGMVIIPAKGRKHTEARKTATLLPKAEDGLDTKPRRSRLLVGESLPKKKAGIQFTKAKT